ncbi:Serpin (serine protease inhibitor) (plasmid) [Tautonia plasticadhaerens]|uniref:Serpin (Serine protease inhibitor) n=1 Tax=Tautonia plasticadhaerens TaxID=2527974 RepID=A0A518HEI9_9BACT|nr:Serpin (serine protease inhibitor) [Tautonia plasticadhaerens]
MADVLHFPLPQSELHGAFSDLVAAMDPEGNDRLEVANRLWGQRGYDFQDDFLALIRDRYGAELGQVDFARETDQARRRINDWVA